MFPSILIDTDILIDVARKNQTAIEKLEFLQKSYSLSISIITQMELTVGCRNKIELQSLEKFLLRFGMIKLTEKISDKSIFLLKKYRLSHGLLIADALIAASALETSMPFITKNQRDFNFIEGLDLRLY